MLLADAGYPYVVKTTTDARAIDGEVYVVDDDTLERLDALEEIATGMYSRESVEVTMTGTPGTPGTNGAGRQPAEIFTSGLRRILSWSYTTKAMAMLGMILT